VLLRQGALESHLILLRRGSVKVTVATLEGHQALLAIRIRGDLLGEISALNQTPRSATVTTCVESTYVIIHKREFQSYLAHRPGAALEVVGMVADRLRLANQFRVDFSSYPVKVRLARVLAKIAMSYGEPTPSGLLVRLPLTQPELASLCGAAEVTVQKALRALRNEGLVVTSYRHVTVTDISALRRAGLMTPEDQ
jgi:CRP-like cAMP-binding protein